MKAKNIISPLLKTSDYEGVPEVSADMPFPEVLSVMSLSPEATVRVTDKGKTIGVINPESAMNAISLLFAPKTESSYVECTIPTTDYSASRLAMAVEDADAHLTDLWTYPAEKGYINIILRTSRQDSQPVANSLKRYGFDVTDNYSITEPEYTLSDEAANALRIYLNI